MLATLVAPDTMVCLAQLGYATVISHQERTARLAVVLVLLVLGYVTLVDALVVVKQDGRYIDAIGTRHAIFAVVARYGGVLLE